MKSPRWLGRLGPCLLVFVLAGCASSLSSRDVTSEIYDTHADGQQQLATALTQARKTGKRVLLDLGANWCSDSQATYRLFKSDPAIRQQIKEHFVLVMVDADQRQGEPRNKELADSFGDILSRGIPVLLILSADGKLLNADRSERLKDDAHTRPAEVLAYLRKWSR